MRRTRIINLFGGPGIGKSTLAAELFVAAKRQHLDAENITEYAKDLIWDGRDRVVKENQIAILGEQWNRIYRLLGKVDVIFCDSPVLLCSVYAPDGYPEDFHRLALWCHSKVDSVNLLLERHSAPYQTAGRAHAVDFVRLIDQSIESILKEHTIKYYNITATESVNVAINVLKNEGILADL